MFSYYIAMPSGMNSQPRSHTHYLEWVTFNGRIFRVFSKGKDFDEDSLLKEIHHIRDILRSWPDFECHIVLLEDGIEMSREYILGRNIDATKQAG